MRPGERARWLADEEGRTRIRIGSSAWFGVERAAKPKNQTGAVNPSPTLPAIETSLDIRSSWRTPPKRENSARDFELCRRALRSNLKLRTPAWRHIRSVAVRFRALSKGISLVVRILIFAERPELRHAGPKDMNREAELDRPSRVACSDLLDIVFISSSSHKSGMPHLPGESRHRNRSTGTRPWQAALCPSASHEKQTG